MGDGVGRECRFLSASPRPQSLAAAGSPPAPGGWASHRAIVTSGITFQKLVWRETSWAQGGRISASLSLGGGERRRGGEEVGPREELAGLWKAINGERERNDFSRICCPLFPSEFGRDGLRARVGLASIRELPWSVT